MVNMLLLLSLLAQMTSLLALPTPTTTVSTTDVDTRVVNRPTQPRPASPTITGSLVQDVKQINILLNIPNGCNNIYDSLIRQIENCRQGSDRGHPDLDNGCLLRLDFQKYKDQCRNSKLSFPASEESSNLEFVGRDIQEANVAFPEEK